ncbi:hypothetical protein AAVH_25136 [Aphelenchoides avenae]|nr:hypothetical protein AAVH_25136 [Aphelenchus avenae]
MESTTDEIPAKRLRIENHEKTQIPQETMLEVLLWLDRFDLDAKQVTSRRFRSLVENKQMPLRKLSQVAYTRSSGLLDKTTLSIRLEGNEALLDAALRYIPANAYIRIETDSDVQKAVSYLSSCVVGYFSVFGHHDALPENAIIAAPALIRELNFKSCNFSIGEEDTLSETLMGSTFQRLSFCLADLPVSQIDDKRLLSLRQRGCNELVAFHSSMDDAEKFHVTEEGMLSYCFTLDDDSPVPESRLLEITSVNITPAFFKKVVEASKNSRLTCDVELSLFHLRLEFDVGNLDLGVPPVRSQEWDGLAAAYLHNVRYDIPDHGNGIRLLVRFKKGTDTWIVTVRHGKKDHEEFFGWQPEEEEDDVEYDDHESGFEDSH